MRIAYEKENEKIFKLPAQSCAGVNAVTCEVYVYSRNGLAKKVSVTVE